MTFPELLLQHLQRPSFYLEASVALLILWFPFGSHSPFWWHDIFGLPASIYGWKKGQQQAGIALLKAVFFRMVIVRLLIWPLAVWCDSLVTAAPAQPSLLHQFSTGSAAICLALVILSLAVWRLFVAGEKEADIACREVWKARQLYGSFALMCSLLLIAQLLLLPGATDHWPVTWKWYLIGLFFTFVLLEGLGYWQEWQAQLKKAGETGVWPGLCWWALGKSNLFLAVIWQWQTVSMYEVLPPALLLALAEELTDRCYLLDRMVRYLTIHFSRKWGSHLACFLYAALYGVGFLQEVGAYLPCITAGLVALCAAYGRVTGKGAAWSLAFFSGWILMKRISIAWPDLLQKAGRSVPPGWLYEWWQEAVPFAILAGLLALWYMRKLHRLVAAEEEAKAEEGADFLEQA